MLTLVTQGVVGVIDRLELDRRRLAPDVGARARGNAVGVAQ